MISTVIDARMWVHIHQFLPPGSLLLGDHITAPGNRARQAMVCGKNHVLLQTEGPVHPSTLTLSPARCCLTGCYVWAAWQRLGNRNSPLQSPKDDGTFQTKE